MSTPAIGITYLPALEPLLVESGLVDVVELEPQMFWAETGDPESPYRSDTAFEARIRALGQDASVHSVANPIGGSAPPDPAHLRGLAATVAKLEPVVLSDHLSFNLAGPPRSRYWAGAFLPPLQCDETVTSLAANIRAFSKATGRTVAVEPGVNYLSCSTGKLSDGDFVARVVEAADCGILLDLHNVWTNEVNGRQQAADFLSELPHERVWEIHVAGGLEFEGFWLDAHSGEVPPPVLRLLADLVPSLPNLRVVNFEIVPEYARSLGLDAIRAQLGDLRDACLGGAKYSGRRAKSWAPMAAPNPGPQVTPEEWENTLGAVVTGQSVDGELADVLRCDPGVRMQRSLVESVRAGALTGVLRFSVRLMLLTLGPAKTREVFADFWTNQPPSAFAGSEARAFGNYVAQARLTVPYLDEVLAFELAAIQSVTRHKVSAQLWHNPVDLLGPLAVGRLPERIGNGNYEIELEDGLVLDEALRNIIAEGRGPSFST